MSRFVSRRRPRLEFLESRVFLSATQIIRNGGFEGTVASTDWGHSGYFQADSRFTNYHSGTGYAYLANTDGSSGNNLAGKLFQKVTIPSDASAATFSFWSKITTSETTTTAQNDKMTVTITDATGANVLQSLTTLSNLDKSTSYVQKTFTLSPALLGQTVNILFNASTNGTLATTFRVDDVSLLADFPTSAAAMKVVGYLPYYRYSSFGQMDLNLVTHINYFSIQTSSAGVLSTPNIVNANLDNVVATMHALGKTVSITVGPTSLSTLAANETSRNTFAANIKTYLDAHNLDGVDIDWEPPGGTATNVANYGLLIDALYTQLHPSGKLITAAVNPYTKEIPAATVNAQMDWLNIMCYDFHYDNTSPYSESVSGMNGWASYGVQKSKLVMGVPYYGKYGTSWSDAHSKTYNTILNDYKNVYGDYPAPEVDSYLDGANNLVYFNGQATMQKKMAFLRDNGFAGTMIWELGQDHWDGSADYDVMSHQPVVATMMMPPSWLAPGVGSTFNLVGSDFYVNLGTVTLLSDAGGQNPGVKMNLDPGATVVLNASQRLGGLNVPAGASVNIKGNQIALDYTGGSPIGGWNGSGYTGITGLIQSGRNGGGWNGKGIMTTMASAKWPSMLGTVAVAEASTALGVPAGQLAVWNGQLVDATTVLVRYTYGGDANLDGALNGDDYFAIDAGFASQAKGFAAGDFNYDGKIDTDDYFILDSNYNKSGVPLSTVIAPGATASAAIFRDGRAIDIGASSTVTLQTQRKLIDELEADLGALV